MKTRWKASQIFVKWKWQGKHPERRRWKRDPG